MKKSNVVRRFGLMCFAALCAALTTNPVQAQTPAQNRVFYAATGGAQMRDSLVLSDGTLLVSGGADSMQWLPRSAGRIVLDGAGIIGAVGGNRVAFLLHLSADATKVLHCAALPPGMAFNFARLRTTRAPGEKTGDLYVSGLTQIDKSAGSGYFIARLDGNFVDKMPTKMQWVRNVHATKDHREMPVWDVGGDGKVLFVTGEPFSPNWAAVQRLNADGSDDVVPRWRYHYVKTPDGNTREVAATKAPADASYSALIFKHWGRADLRSWTAEEFEAWIPDGNGGTKKGSWPLDAFFNGPANPTDSKLSGKAGGYTGYKTGANPTQRIGDIVIDRRTNDFYIGFAIQSTLPEKLPDFEPAILAMDADGTKKWWSRLYHEYKDDNKNGRLDAGEHTNSHPDQYVDHLGIDYQNDSLVVLARAHGNHQINLWSGDKVASNPTGRGFKSGWTGRGGNFHISWLGKLGLADGTLYAASYVAEMEDGMQGAAEEPSTDPLLDGWPDPNAAWPTLNTTRVRAMNVDAQGRVAIIGNARRTITTSNAFQKMIKKAEGPSVWNDFVRVYKADLSGIEYSSLLTGNWDKTTGRGGDNIAVTGVAFLPKGVLAIGTHEAYTQKNVEDSIETAKKMAYKEQRTPLSLDVVGQPKGNPIPTASSPDWGKDKPEGESGIIAVLAF